MSYTELVISRDLRVAPVQWLRGPANLNDGWVELDRQRAHPYTPMEEVDLMYDLAAIRRPPDALAFVQRYGLLRHGPGADKLRESFAEIETAALTLDTTIAWYLRIARVVRGDTEDANNAIREMWRLAPKLGEHFDGTAKSDDELIDQATQLVAYWTNQGLIGVESKVTPSAHYTDPRGNRGEAGGFSMSAHATTLLGLAYHQLALTITMRIPLRECVECGRYFEIKDRRQRFCSPTCGSRARQRRFAQKKDAS
jgi:hypothetical protein